MKAEELKKVQIKWIDSIRSDGWQYYEDISAEPMECESIGFLIKESANCYAITSTIGNEPLQMCQYLSIPKCAVTEFKVLDI